MQEDGAAGAASRAQKIVVEDDHDIVEMVGPPETLVARPKRQTHFPVVEPMGGVVAPAGIGPEW